MVQIRFLHVVIFAWYETNLSSTLMPGKAKGWASRWLDSVFRYQLWQVGTIGWTKHHARTQQGDFQLSSARLGSEVMIETYMGHIWAYSCTGPWRYPRLYQKVALFSKRMSSSSTEKYPGWFPCWGTDIFRQEMTMCFALYIPSLKLVQSFTALLHDWQCAIDALAREMHLIFASYICS